SLANCSAKYGSGLTGLKEACVASSNPESTITEQSAQTIWKAVRGMVTGVSSPPSITNLGGRMLAAPRTPLTASGSAPGRTVLIARMVARSGEKSAALRRSETSASVTSKDTQFFLSAVPRCHHPRKRMIQYSLVSRFRSSQDLAAHSRANFGIKGTLANL